MNFLYRSLAPWLWLLWGIFLFGFGVSAETEPGAPQEVQAIEVEEAGTLLQPRAQTDAWFVSRSSGSGMMGSMVLFLLMLVVIAGFWIYTKRGGSSMRQLGASKDLRIRETRALGNRQFLVVVEYGEQRMLLGVAPGVINHLCYLDAPNGEGGQGDLEQRSTEI